MTQYSYGQFTEKHLETIKKGVELFNQQMYWECHEELEHHWLDDIGDPARNVYWAVIQVAASMIHFRDSNLAGAKGLINKAKEKFIRCEDKKVETELMNKYLSWDILKEMVFKVNDEPEIDEFKDLFNFRFIDPSKWEEL